MSDPPWQLQEAAPSQAMGATKLPIPWFLWETGAGELPVKETSALAINLSNLTTNTTF